MLDVEGFILVGGASSRMGADKSRLVFNGKTSVERIADALRSLTTEVRLVGSRQTNAHGLPNVPDIQDQWGPLGGIHAALRASEAEWCAVVGCDFPLVTRQLFARLWEFTHQVEPQPCAAVVPIQSDHRPQPLCALYRRKPCLHEAERLIAGGEHMPRALLEKVKTRFVVFGEFSDLDGAEYFFFNVNTPEDYEHAKQILDVARSRSR